MGQARTLSVIVVKPSKYGRNRDGKSDHVERFTWGFMPNATLPFIASMIPEYIGNTRVEVTTVDEYVQTDLQYMRRLERKYNGNRTLVILAGVQSHQFQRALDLGAYAIAHGSMAVIGGPHPMTCDTTMLQGRGVSFALAEAETVLLSIISDAAGGELQAVYGEGQRWAKNLDAPVLKIPPKAEYRRYVSPLLGVYPFRGCPFVCDFCSVIKIAGRNIRSQPIETTMATLREAAAHGIDSVFFTSDNFNKYREVRELCQAIIDDRRLRKLRFFVQCDVQIVRQPDLIDLFARAGVFQIFLGIESLDAEALKGVHKMQNKPQMYRQIRNMCVEAGIDPHFSMITGFPTDTRGSVLAQLEALIDINPSMASFYTLCPIPGTAQYDDFMDKGLIVERNLDRFDTICATWKHPTLPWDELERLRNHCYREFYSLRHDAAYTRKGNQLTRTQMCLLTLFVQYCALPWKMDHPMSGGVLRRRKDRVADYIDLRRKTFGFDLAPLPASLRLSKEEDAYNKQAKISA